MVSAVRAGGELSKSFVQTHPALAGLDKALGWMIMIFLLGLEGSTLGFAIYGFVINPAALGLFTVSACVCSFTITLLTFMLWHTFCYYDPRMRKIMTTSTRFTPNGFMRVGFLPIPAAASVGLLLWVTAVLVSPSIQGGALLQLGTAGGLLAWMPTMTCRASGVERADYLTSWDARMERSAPSAHQASIARLLSLFGAESSETVARRADEGSCFMAPYAFTQDDVMDTKTGKDLLGITNLNNPQGDTEGRLCMYHCVQWQSINLQTLLTSSGTISVGAGIVVVFTELISGKLGLPTITEDTSAPELESLINRIGAGSWSRALMKPFQTSMVACAIPILAIGLYFKYFLVGKIDADGYSTVDYYVVYCLLYSVSIVTLMRMWHFFECRPQLYTKNLWHDGLDSFIVPLQSLEDWTEAYGKGEIVKIKDIGDHLCLVSIDLYQWMHLRSVERTELLVNYCRRPSQGGTEANAKLQVVAPCKVTLTHEVDLGAAGKCKCEKIVELPAHQELIVVGWKNELMVKVNVPIAGVMETVSIEKQQCLEKSPEWNKDIFDTMPGSVDGQDPESVSPFSKRSIQPLFQRPAVPVSALQAQLLTLEQKCAALQKRVEQA